jgi:hypothetical protein
VLVDLINVANSVNIVKMLLNESISLRTRTERNVSSEKHRIVF